MECFVGIGRIVHLSVHSCICLQIHHGLYKTHIDMEKKCTFNHSSYEDKHVERDTNILMYACMYVCKHVCTHGCMYAYIFHICLYVDTLSLFLNSHGNDIYCIYKYIYVVVLHFNRISTTIKRQYKC